jgi:iron complex transport system substrate-binding protein
MRMAILGAVVAALATPTFAETVTVETALGPVAVEAEPAKVAVFDIPALDSLTTLGVPVAGVPNKLYTPYLQERVGDAAVVGTLFEPDFEALAVMAPDLVVIGGRASSQYDAVSKVAPAIDMTIRGTGIVEQAKARLTAYGEIFGKTDQAAEVIAQIDTKLDEAKAAVAGKGNVLIILTNGTKISAFGPGSRFGWLHEALSLPVAAEGLAAETHGEAISFEFISETNPDWILVVDRGAAIGQNGEAAEATLDNPLVASTKAAQSGQIIYLDAAPIYVAGGGATALQITLDEIIAAFAQAQG